jgi:hypothetical protein
MKKIQYGLREIKTKKMVTYNVSSNGDAENCGETTTSLSIDDKDSSLWLVENESQGFFTNLPYEKPHFIVQPIEFYEQM